MGRTVTPSIPATTSIVNYFSSGGTSQTTANSPTRKTVLSGAATAGELVTVLSVGGSGWCPLLYAYNNVSLVTHTIRLQVLVDGATVFDATSDSIATSPARRSIIAVGNAEGPNYVWDGQPIRFNGALVVRIASSQAGTDYVGLAYEYYLA